MEKILNTLNIYMIPPALSLITGLSIAIIALRKGKHNFDNTMFGLVCIWSSLLPLVFLTHQIFKGQIDLILIIERTTHFFYVYVLFITTLFFQYMTNYINKRILIITFLLCFIISCTTFTDLYITGLTTYEWGYMAKQGITFSIFGACSIFYVGYGSFLFILRLRTENDFLRRYKLIYIASSIAISGALTLGNIPALYGIDFYPLGNFIFIPLMFMAWGIYRHEVIRINMYTIRRINATILRIFQGLGFIGMIIVSIWSLGDFTLEHIINRTIPYGIPQLISMVFCMLSSIHALKLGENRKEMFAFSIITLFSSFLCLDMYINAIIDNIDHGLIIARLDHIFFVFLPALTIHLVYIVTGYNRGRWFLYVSYITGGIFSIFTQSDYYIKGIYTYSWGFFAKKAVLFDLFLIASLMGFIYSLIILFQSFKKEKNPHKKNSVRLLFISIIGSSVLCIGNMGAANGYDIYPTANFIFIPMILWSFGIFRDNIPGLINFANRIFQYAGAGITIVLIAYMQTHIAILSNSPPIIMAAVTILAYIAFKSIWGKLSKKIFRDPVERSKIAYAQIVNELSNIRALGTMVSAIADGLFLNNVAQYCIILMHSQDSNDYQGKKLINPFHDNHELEDKNQAELTKIPFDHQLMRLLYDKHLPMKQEEIEEWILNNEYILEKNDIMRLSEVLIPIFHEKGLLAVILVGPKIDGSIYSSHEFEFFEQLSLNLGSHIQNISLLENLETMVRERTLKLEKSEEKQISIIENLKEAYFEIDLAGTVTFCNEALAEFFDMTKEETLGKNFKELLTKEEADRASLIFNSIYRTGNISKVIEWKYEGKNKKTKISEGTITLSLDENGKKVGFRILSRDITERKKAEQERRELEEQKSRFFANISHEIRTPLTLMLSPIEAALQHENEIKLNDEFLNNLYRNGLRLHKLINNLLDYSKIEAGRMSIRVGKVDIIDYTNNFKTIISPATEVKDISLSMISNIESGVLYLDIEKMDKVFMNITSNALKFTDRGGAITMKIADNETSCSVSFHDTGPGIPADKLDLVFDRFGQTGAIHVRKHEGSGIGLALAKEFVEMHGGTITVESRYIENHPDNHGSSFTVVLRKGKDHFMDRPEVAFVEADDIEESITGTKARALREIEDLTSPAQGYRGNSAESTSLSSKNTEHIHSILIVDDNPEMLSFISMLLEKNYTIYTAGNGQEGIDSVRKHRPDLIITDVMMPVMNGYEMTQALKADSVFKQIPIIMITAKADISQKIEGLEYGADDYLVKPFNPRELHVRIRTLLKTVEFEKIIMQRNMEVEHELGVARMLQQRLLPDMALIASGYSLHPVFIPMDKIGGDFYDFRQRDHFIDLFIADVSGHGLSGAFLATITKMAKDHIETDASPSRILCTLNDVVRRFSVTDNFITAFCCILDTKTNIMKYSCAGHPRPLLYRGTTRTFIPLESKGKLLGLFQDIKLEEKEIMLSAGDRLVLYTDGITECMGTDREMFSEDGLKETISSTIGLSPDQFCSELLVRLKKFCGSDTFEDDLTMIALDIL